MNIRSALKRISLEAATERLRIAEKRYIGKDPRELGIEPKIRPVVTALIAHGFSTQNSCEGHLESNLYPWVRIAPQAKDRTKKSLLEQRKRLREEAAALEELLGKYWQAGHRLPSDRSLQVLLEVDQSSESDKLAVEKYLRIRAQRFVALPGFMLRCFGAEMLDSIPCEILRPHRNKILKQRQKDMLEFGKFLVSRL